MRALVIAICLAAGAADAGEDGVAVRQLAGIGASVSDYGFGLGAQLGVRISPLLLRVTLDVRGANSRGGYSLASARADWLYPIERAGTRHSWSARESADCPTASFWTARPGP
jgi:hypothetical protein